MAAFRIREPSGVVLAATCPCADEFLEEHPLARQVEDPQPRFGEALE